MTQTPVLIFAFMMASFALVLAPLGFAEALASRRQ